MKAFFVIAFFWPVVALAQTANPNPAPGSVWTNYGPTLGAGWSDGPPTFGGMNPEASNATLPTARTNLGTLPVLNAKTDYGATGDGTTNDGPALTAALAACNSAHPLYLPPGTYKTKTPNLTVPANCKIYSNNTYAYVYNATPGATIEGDNSSGTFSVGDAIFVTASSTSTIESLQVWGVPAVADSVKITGGGVLRKVTLANGRRAVQCNSGVAIIEDSTLSNTTDVPFAGACPDALFRNNWVHNGGATAGFYYTGVKIQVLGNIFEWNTGDGIKIDGRFGGAQDIIVANNWFDRNSAYNLEIIGPTTSVVVSGNAFRRGFASGAGGCHINYFGALTSIQEYGNTFLKDAINDDGSGIVTPDYTYCADPGVTFTASTIADNSAVQNVGVYNVGVQALLAKSIDTSNQPTTTLGSSTLVVGGALTTVTGLTLQGTTFSGTGASFTTSPVLNNAVPLKSKDTGGTVRDILQYLSDNKVYLSGGSSGLVLQSNNGTATAAVADATGNVTFSHAARLATATAGTILAITCNAGFEGAMFGVTDANSAVFNAAVAAGGANHMIAYCNGTAWVIH